jgi:uncharacterized protein (UPF0548 family)
MLFLRKPAGAAIRALIERERGGPYSYAEVGATRGLTPPGYNVDHNRVKLGEGAEVFDVASAALRRWEMFHLGWVEMTTPDAPVAEGSTVGVLVRLLGVYSLNLCRIVYVVDERGSPLRRFGFAYGTLGEHAESGEERFTVELDETTGAVHYDILAFSQPNHILAKVAYPYTRVLQRRFAVGSMLAMKRACDAEDAD